MAQNSSQTRPPGTFPSPHSYPSPSMSAYAYPPPSHGQNTEAYRASPTGSTVSLPSLNLPPIRTMDGRPQSQQGQQSTQHQSQPQVPQPQMGAPLPPPMGAYYPTMPVQSLPPPQHMSVTSDPNQPMRYPLPPPDGRMMSGGRHKKEIKRRTKTGCLTCRKRRIKVCDCGDLCSHGQWISCTVWKGLVVSCNNCCRVLLRSVNVPLQARTITIFSTPVFFPLQSCIFSDSVLTFSAE